MPSRVGHLRRSARLPPQQDSQPESRQARVARRALSLLRVVPGEVARPLIIALVALVFPFCLPNAALALFATTVTFCGMLGTAGEGLPSVGRQTPNQERPCYLTTARRLRAGVLCERPRPALCPLAIVPTRVSRSPPVLCAWSPLCSGFVH